MSDFTLRLDILALRNKYAELVREFREHGAEYIDKNKLTLASSMQAQAWALERVIIDLEKLVEQNQPDTKELA